MGQFDAVSDVIKMDQTLKVNISELGWSWEFVDPSLKRKLYREYKGKHLLALKHLFYGILILKRAKRWCCSDIEARRASMSRQRHATLACQLVYILIAVICNLSVCNTRRDPAFFLAWIECAGKSKRKSRDFSDFLKEVVAMLMFGPKFNPFSLENIWRFWVFWDPGVIA